MESSPPELVDKEWNCVKEKLACMSNKTTEGRGMSTCYVFCSIKPFELKELKEITQRNNDICYLIIKCLVDYFAGIVADRIYGISFTHQS